MDLRINETLQTGGIRKTKLPSYRLVGTVSNCAYSVRWETEPTGGASVYSFLEFTIIGHYERAMRDGTRRVTNTLWVTARGACLLLYNVYLSLESTIVDKLSVKIRLVQGQRSLDNIGSRRLLSPVIGASPVPRNPIYREKPLLQWNDTTTLNFLAL